MKIKLHKLSSDYYNKSLLFIRRTLISYIVILLLLGILLIHLYKLQIVYFNDYQIKSNKNCIKSIPIPANRGIIYDCNGNALAINKIIYQLHIFSEKTNNIQKTIKDLQNILGIDHTNFLIYNQKDKKSSKISFKIELTEIQLARFAVNKFRFTGVELQEYLQRYYPYGSTLTHVIGYVSKIDQKDQTKLHNEGIINSYVNNDNIGKLGIERYYEKFLHGKCGYQTVEVNNRGKIIRIINKKEPEAGKDIFLTLDINLQKYIKKLLANDRAAVIVLDPRDGSIQALVSNPSYDPNEFVQGISKKKYNNLLCNNNCPLLNRATQGIYPPASTVKPYILVSALTLGIINKNFSIWDPGWWKLPGSTKYYRDWKKWGHGKLNVINAIEESSDTFFYQLAYNMGIDKLSEWMNKFGYGKYTGIDLFEELIGNMPNKNWKIKRFKQPWYQGDTISVGIGQGYWTATPIQMSKALITLINNGAVKVPHLLKSIMEEPIIYYNQKEKTQIGDSTSIFWEIVKKGMFAAANNTNGTVSNNFINSQYKVAAKSGTAQIFSIKDYTKYNIYNINKNLKDHKLMIAFAPFEKPTTAIVIILENGGTGKTIGTITRNILDFIMLNNNIYYNN